MKTSKHSRRGLPAATLLLFLLLWSVVGATSAARAGQAAGERHPNIVLLVGDDWRWDTLGSVTPYVKTPRLDALARDGIRFEQARVTTPICMVSRATLLTGQYMSRHGITEFGKPIPPPVFAHTYPAVLRAAGYWTGFVGKYGVGAARKEDFDFLRSYEGVHWLKAATGERLHVTEKNARDSLEFLRTRPKNQPFCLSVSFFAPHAEDRAPEQYLPQPWSERLYAGVDIPVPPTATEEHFRKLPPFLAAEANEGRIRWRKRFDTPEKFQTYMKNYYRLVSEVDDAIGRVIDELKSQGVYDNTLIVFIGDNGYFHADRGLADKWYPYEQSLRVPLIVHDPRLPQQRRGQIKDSFALNIDVAPTLVAAAGLQVPDVMQGKDFAPLYLSPTPPAWRDEFFAEHPVVTNKERIPASEAVVRRNVKYAYWPDYGYEQLFDLNADPWEARNLASDPAHADHLRQMRMRLEAWRQRVR